MIVDVKEKEGLILSPSSAANLVGSIRVASNLGKRNRRHAASRQR
ncbi:MAG: hypothetical protein WDM78_00830 [Puia sp.]